MGQNRGDFIPVISEEECYNEWFYNGKWKEPMKQPLWLAMATCVAYCIDRELVSGDRLSQGAGQGAYRAAGKTQESHPAVKYAAYAACCQGQTTQPGYA